MDTKYKNSTLVEVYNALATLNPPSQEAEAKAPKTSFAPRTIYCFAKNMRMLKPIVDDIETVRRSIFKKYQKGDEEYLKGSAAEAFKAELEQVLEDETEFKFHTIDINTVDLLKNPISHQILGALLDVVIVGELSD